MQSVETGSVQPKQESEASVSTSTLAPRFSTSVTTGQGGPYTNSWSNNQYTSGRLGNNRAPIPTCSIPLQRGLPSITMVPLSSEDNQRSSSAKVADAMLGGSPRVQVVVPNTTNAGSGSLESTQDQVQPSEGSYPRTDDSDSEEEEDEEEEEQQMLDGLRRSTTNQRRNAYKVQRKQKEKKKVGRPIAYKGDPNAPELTEQERRRIKRRIANRESARRVRNKRQEILEEMQGKMESMQAHNVQLMRHAQEIEGQKSQLFQQLVELESKFKRTTSENLQMQQEIQALRQTLQMKMTALEYELDKRANEAEPETTSAFSAPASQPAASFSMAHPLLSCSQGTMMTMSRMDSKASLDAKMALEFFPSLNLDDLPSTTRAESMDMFASILNDEHMSATAAAAGVGGPSPNTQKAC